MGKITATATGFPDDISVIDYTVTEDITPLAPGDSSGGVGSISVQAVAVKSGPIAGRTATILDTDLTLTDLEDIEMTGYKGRGSVFGHVTKNAQNGARVTLTSETLLARLNTERKAKPFFGAKKTGTRVTYATNIATNPSLETATTNWAAVPGTSGAATVSRSNATYSAFAGSWHGRVTWTGSASGVGGVTYTQAAVLPNTLLNVSLQMRVPTRPTGQVMRASIAWYNASAALISTTDGVATNLTSSGYVEVKVTGTAPALTASAVVTFYNYNSGGPFVNWSNGDILVFDALMISGTVQPYFDGSSANASWNGTANASTSTLAISTPINEGYDATLGNAVRYYMGLAGIPESAIIVDNVFENFPVAYPAWEGNIWNYMKQLCAAVGAEIAVSGPSIYFRAPRQHTVLMDNEASLDLSVDAQATALSIEIYNYNSRWGVSEVVYAATNTLSIPLNTNSESIINVDASITAISSPLPVAKLVDVATYTGPGQYVVSDANDVIVAPDSWTALGGKLIAELIPGSFNSFKLTVQGPSSAGAYTAPFRVAVPSVIPDGDDTPALYITAEGVFIDKQVVTLPTAATLSQTSNETAPTIDNIFISSYGQAVDRGVLAAMAAGGPTIRINGMTTYDRSPAGQDFNVFVGGRVRNDFNIFRVDSANFTSSAIEFTAQSDVTFADVIELYSVTFAENNATYSGLNFTTYNGLWTGKTFAEVMALSPTPSFDSINALYSGLTFNDHAIYPLMETKINAEARF